MPTQEHGDSATGLLLTLDITPWHTEWNNSFPWVMADGKIGGKTRLAECLSFCQVLLGPPHNKEMDWQVEKEDREASVIYCLQPGRSVQLLWQSIYQRNQNILHHLHRDVLQIQITSFVVLWLNKSIKNSYVPQQVCVTKQHTHIWNLSKPPLQLAFNAGKMHYLCAVKWTPLLQQGQKVYLLHRLQQHI